MGESVNRFEKVNIDKLIPYARNARTHSKEQIKQLQSSLREFGFVNPVIVDKDLNIIAGHGRILAAKEENITEVPCVFVEHLTEAQKKAYILADNRLALNAGWDTDMLAVELGELANDFDLEMLGFGAEELNKLLDTNEVQDDDFDIDKALEDEPFVMRGDIWHLGKHRLMCGDSTNADDVAKLMNGDKANLFLADFPYGVSYEGNAGKIKNDDLRGEEFYNFILSAMQKAYDVLADEASAYIFHADTMGEYFRRAFRVSGFKLSGVCQWIKPSLVLGRSPYQWQHEPILFGWKQNGKHKWYAGRSETTTWNFGKPKKNDIHPTMKPIDLLAYPIKNSSAVNSIVLDNFVGSGSTIVACQQTDRIGYGMEIDEKYASAAVKRIADTVGVDNCWVQRNGQKLKLSEVIS